jgi:RimJ/RimL family protein N-acetyltransferase
MIDLLRAQLNAWFDEKFPIPEPPITTNLVSERLLLREMEEEDLPSACAYLGDPEALRYLDRTTPYSEQQVWMRIYAARKQVWRKPRDYYALAVVIRESAQMIGECTLTLLYSLDNGNPTGGATIGFIFNREHWNRGYATEAAAAVLRFAFVDLGLENVYGGCLPDNVASRRVLETLEMKYQLAEQDFPGSPHGIKAQVFGIDRESWLARN